MLKRPWTVVLLGMLGLCVAFTSAAQAQSRQQLENQKLSEEVRQLQIANERSDSTREDILDYAPFITILVALLGAGVPLWKEARERRRQREEALEQQVAEFRQTQLETQRHFEDQFAAAIANLDTEKSEAVRVSAAISLGFFVSSEYAQFRDKVFPVLCANLTVKQPRTVNRFLVQAFEKALALKLAEDLPEGKKREPQDLARCHLDHAKFSGLDLTEADLGFTHLRCADLTGCNLERARGYEVHIEKARLSRSTLSEARLQKARGEEAQFHDATMHSVKLREATLPKAEFFGAKLQEAHFDKADLRGATFDQANVTEAYFREAQLDEAALKSLLNASGRSWEKAHFDPDVSATLERLDKQRRGKRKNRGA